MADHARLWLSARFLLDPAAIPHRGRTDTALVLADDLRPLLEAVYADDPPAPAVLRARHAKAEGDAVAETQQGYRARLSFREGYLDDWGGRDTRPDDAAGEPRTRLIDSATVILAVVEAGSPRLLGTAAGPMSAVEASECRSPRPLGPLPGQDGLLQALRARLTRGEVAALERSPVVFLTDCTAGVWEGQATGLESEGPAARLVTVQYSRKTGLRVRSGTATFGSS